MTAGAPAFEVIGPYETRDPSKPYAVGARTPGMGYHWRRGDRRGAEIIAGALRAGLITPREVDGLSARQEAELERELAQ